MLLDALDALGPHRDAIVLVGAQAVYQRVGAGSLAVAPFTTDGDLAIDPAVLANIPPLEEALMASGFRPKTADSVGVWISTRPTAAGALAVVSVDLLVPASVSPGLGRRAARLPGHDQRAARIVKGLDGALVDADVMPIAALDEQDARSFAIRVAGPAALLVAKVHKIDERQGTGRQSDKDALDVLRLLQGTETDDLATRYGQLLADRRSRDAAEVGLDLIHSQFAAPRGAGIAMAIRSAGVLASEDEITASCEVLASDLLAALKS
ncbi:MAG TPA: GSU2403 family nucleotidyltransferase fold protein [Polyangiaceae bacterium]|nr:GSU2403 family nucleotidyltransferase fold protein [Polyangiaceae bacterium]